MTSKTHNNFGGLTGDFSDYGKSAVAIVPVPFGKACTWGKGCERGPAAIINASMNMELYDTETNREAYLKGISTGKPVNSPDSESMVNDVYKRVKALIKDKKFVVVLGGDHSVCIGSVRAHREAFSNLSILHLDAHSDRRECYDDNRYSHACAMARAGEFVKNIVSVGIRSMDSSEIARIDRKKMFFAETVMKSGDWIKAVVNQLSMDVYLSIDMDVFDNGIMPSTGTPEPGGLDWYQVTDLLRAVSEKRNVVGLDVVELCPIRDLKGPDFMTAKLIYKILSYNYRKF